MSLNAKIMLVRTALFHSHDWLITRNCSHHFGPAQAPTHGMYTVYLSDIPMPKWHDVYVGDECSYCHAGPSQVLSTHAYATVSSTQSAQRKELKDCPGRRHTGTGFFQHHAREMQGLRKVCWQQWMTDSSRDHGVRLTVGTLPSANVNESPCCFHMGQL